MFYDRLLNLKSLKTRLLSSSSTALLYSSDQKLPLAKFRREGMNLTPLIAGLLAACGGSTTYVPVGEVVITTSGDGSSDGGTTSGGTGPFAATDFTVTVADGVIEGALVYIDTNNNGTFDAGDISLGRTDATGSVAVGAQYEGQEITVDLAGSFDLFTATEFTGGDGADIFEFDPNYIADYRLNITDFVLGEDKIRIDTANANETTWEELGFAVARTAPGDTDTLLLLRGSLVNSLYIENLLTGVSEAPGTYIDNNFDTIFEIV